MRFGKMVILFPLLTGSPIGSAWAKSDQVTLPPVEIKTQREFKIYRNNEIDQVISDDQLATYEDLSEALSYEADVMSVDTPQGKSVTVDGLGKDRHLWVVDGVPQVGRTEGALDTDLVPFFLMESVRISRHPGQAQVGDQALGGSVQLRTYEWGQAFVHHTKVGFRGTQHNFYRGDVLQSVPMWDGQGWLRVGLDLRHQSQYFLPGEAQSQSDEDDLTAYLAALQYHHRINPRQMIVTTAFGGEKQETGLLDNLEHRVDRWKLHGDSAWQSWWNDVISSEHKLAVTQTRFQFQENPTAGVFQTNDTTSELQVFGASYWQGKFWSHHRIDGGLDVQWLQLKGERIQGSKAQTTVVGAYVGSNHGWGDHRWEMAPMVRVSTDSEGLWLVSPKWQHTYHLKDNWDFFWGGSVGYKRPSLRERYFAFVSLPRKYQVFGNTDLDPEVAYGGYTGTAYRTPHWVNRIGYDFKWVKNLIATQFTGVDTTGFSNFRTINVEQAIIHQAYGEFQFRLWSAVTQYFRYTFLWARNITLNEPLPQSPVHSVLLETKWDMAAINSDVRLQLQGRDRAGFFDEDRSGFLEADEFMPTHMVANVFYTYHATQRLSVFSYAKNLFNLTSRQFGWSPGFELMLGVRYDSGLGEP